MIIKTTKNNPAIKDNSKVSKEKPQQKRSKIDQKVV